MFFVSCLAGFLFLLPYWQRLVYLPCLRRDIFLLVTKKYPKNTLKERAFYKAAPSLRTLSLVACRLHYATFASRRTFAPFRRRSSPTPTRFAGLVVGWGRCIFDRLRLVRWWFGNGPWTVLVFCRGRCSQRPAPLIFCTTGR